jgi:hypothetical protein
MGIVGMELRPAQEWQVLHDVAEQDEQEFEAVFSRLLPPPIPKEENIFWTSEDPHSGQATPPSPPKRTRISKSRLHFLQINSYSGIRQYFTIFIFRSL